MTRHLFSSSGLEGLSSNIISNELIASTRLAIDHDFSSSKLRYNSQSCQQDTGNKRETKKESV